jgi:hypothetical protein
LEVTREKRHIVCRRIMIRITAHFLGETVQARGDGWMLKFKKQKFRILCTTELSCWTLVSHACNPSQSRGRSQEVLCSKPAPGKWFVRPFLEKTLHKKRLAKWLKVKVPSSSPSTTKKIIF